MASVGDILRRFRSLGVPGPPTAAAVPRDRAAARAGELAPVFLALGTIERHATGVVDQATAWASQWRAQAEAEAVRILSQAHRDAVQAGAEAAEACLAVERGRRREMLAAAHREARRTSRVSQPRVALLAEEVVTRAMAMVAPAPPGASSARHPRDGRSGAT